MIEFVPIQENGKMEYTLRVEDSFGWINTIHETYNMNGSLVLDIDFSPKYLECLQFSSSEDEYGISAMKTDETLHADGQEIGRMVDVYVKPEVPCRCFISQGRYSCTIVLVEETSNHILKYEAQ